jgi:hypothetical protein
MTLSEQSAILLEAVEQELLRQEDIVRWADGVIVAMDKPPAWMIDLSMLTSPHLIDCVVRIREHASVPVSLHRRIQVVVLAYLAGELSFADTLPKVFRVMILERHGVERDALDERLADALVEWDCQEDLSVVEPPLRAKFEALFREYSADAQDVAAVLQWRHENAA